MGSACGQWDGVVTLREAHLHAPPAPNLLGVRLFYCVAAGLSCCATRLMPQPPRQSSLEPVLQCRSPLLRSLPCCQARQRASAPGGGPCPRWSWAAPGRAHHTQRDTWASVLRVRVLSSPLSMMQGSGGHAGALDLAAVQASWFRQRHPDQGGRESRREIFETRIHCGPNLARLHFVRCSREFQALTGSTSASWRGAACRRGGHPVRRASGQAPRHGSRMPSPGASPCAGVCPYHADPAIAMRQALQTQHITAHVRDVPCAPGRHACWSLAGSGSLRPWPGDQVPSSPDPVPCHSGRLRRTGLCARMHRFLVRAWLLTLMESSDRDRPLIRRRCRSSSATGAVPVAALSAQVLHDLRSNDILMSGMCGWFVAQFLKARVWARRRAISPGFQAPAPGQWVSGVV